MAKGKRTVALFEVINKDRRFERKAPPPPPKAAPIVAQDLAAQVKDLRRRQREIDRPPRLPSTLIPKIKSLWTATTTHSTVAVRTAREWANRQQGPMTGVAAALVSIGVVLAARHWIHPTTHQQQTASILQALHDGPAHPSVLVGPGDRLDATAATSAHSPELAADVMQADPLQADLAAAKAKAPVDTQIAQPGARVVNMDYMLIQSYFEEKTATEACNFLNQHGVPCTIERGIKGWRQDFYQVIGLQGFARASGTEYIAYRQHLAELNKEFSPNPRGYKHFQPQPIKW